jgi:cysteine desulfurase
VIYFDHNASSPIAPEALAVLQAVETEVYANPSSPHAAGQRARQIVEHARAQVAELLGCDDREIVFTSGGTEADNLAILGAPAGPIAVSCIEHPAVLTAGEARGLCAMLPVDAYGFVSCPGVAPGTSLISVMHANNETGVIQPIAELAEMAHAAGALFHSDGVQAAGRIPVDVRALGVDLYSISGHKIGAPKGIGALYVRHGVSLAPRQFGGPQEQRLRAGTENVASIAALGAAAALPPLDLAPLRDRLEQRILARVAGTRVIGAEAGRVGNTALIAFEGVSAEALVIALDLAGFAVSTGAACASGATRPSHVLLNMGLTEAEARSCIRFSLGRANRSDHVDELVDAVTRAVARLRHSNA